MFRGKCIGNALPWPNQHCILYRKWFCTVTSPPESNRWQIYECHNSWTTLRMVRIQGKTRQRFRSFFITPFPTSLHAHGTNIYTNHTIVNCSSYCTQLELSWRQRFQGSKLSSPRYITFFLARLVNNQENIIPWQTISDKETAREAHRRFQTSTWIRNIYF